MGGLNEHKDPLENFLVQTGEIKTIRAPSQPPKSDGALKIQRKDSSALTETSTKDKDDKGNQSYVFMLEGEKWQHEDTQEITENDKEHWEMFKSF